MAFQLQAPLTDMLEQETLVSFPVLSVLITLRLFRFPDLAATAVKMTDR